MVISQLKTVRENYVAYTKAQVDRIFVRKIIKVLNLINNIGILCVQEKAMDDMTKWAFKEDNRAIQDALERFNDIHVHWFEAQRSVLKFK